jgi:subtilase family serine protease
MRSPWGRRGAVVQAAAALLLLTMPLAAASAGSGRARIGQALASAARSGPAVVALPQHPGLPGVPFARHPLLVRVRGYTAGGRPVLAASAPGGYTARQLRAYLRLHGSGAGQTVAIVDAFDDPYASSDINTYSAQFGLPATCTRTRTRGCFHFTVARPFGIGGLDLGWAAEESLDVDMVHAIAPRASIVLVEARNNMVGPMFRALGYAATLHPAVISNSWGLGGELASESADDHLCRLAGGVCTFATGDLGNPGGYPAYNPAVIAIGGTSLGLTAAGAILSETAWPESGGGVSAFEPRPAYQDQVNTFPNRGIPDVSFDADPRTGVAVYDSASGGWIEPGGTSVGAPAWAAILAVADQLRAAHSKGPLTAVGYEAQRALYQLRSGLYDITTGSNGSCGTVCTAGPGYDFVTGLGSPRPGIDTALAAAS